MTALDIRPAGHGDIATLLRLIHNAFEALRGRLDPPSGAHAETEGSLRALFDRGEAAALAYRDGAPVGCVFFVQTGVEMYVHRLAVLPEHRYTAVGQSLMSHVEVCAEQTGCAYVRVGVRLALAGNRAFFAHLGYVAIVEDCHAGYAAPTFVHMVKELGAQMLRVVRVTPYDPSWPARFEAEAAAVRVALGESLIAVEHIGSTSVPGLAAKPIIDMMPIVHDVRSVDRRINAMAAAGFVPRGEFGLPGRRYFVKGPAHARLVHCHIYAADNPEVERHLAFRDYLRSHPAAQAAYAELKRDLAQKHPGDIVAYMDGKDGLIKRLEAEALHWRRVNEA